jgi:peptidase M1-like protein
MKKSLSAAALALVLAAPASALEAPRKIVDYDIKVSLDPETKLVEGSETLNWTNPSDVPVAELRFHLYWNAFRNDRSTFNKESGAQHRGDKADRSKGWGYMDVTSMTWGGTDLVKGARFESPDDGNPDDRTVLVVPLPRPVAPGETAAFAIAWKAKVPRVYARAGYVRDFFMFGQWFPEIGVYEPKGRRRRTDPGWNCHQYHANSEFYADWGDYRVAITLPERFVVGSAGALVDTKTAGGKKTLTFEQKSIHNFAFTADPRYVVVEDVFDPAKDIPAGEVARAAKTLGRSEADLRAGFHKVVIRLYLQPDHRAFDRRHIEAQKWALAWTGLWAFPYPYAQVSIVDPPEDGLAAGGMEYETIYTTFSLKWMSHWPCNRLYFPEMVTIHEFTHGYWMGLLASNEFEESWMDEGINTFTEQVMVDRKYRTFLEVPPGIGVTDEEENRRQAALTQDHDPILAASWKFATESSYGRNSYPQTGTTIQQIRNLLGEEAFWRAFRGYAERWRFDHPTSEDFFDFMRASGNSLVADLIRKTWYGRGWVDFAILEAQTKPDDGFTGFDDADRPVNFDPDPKKKPKKEPDDRKHKGPWQSLVVVARDGDIEMPADVVLSFKDGQTVRRTWDGASGWIKYHVTSSSPLVKAEVDPERRTVLDRDPWNNARYTSKYEGPSAAAKGRTYALHLVEILLSTLWSAL